jgi:hypothetical protein
VGYRKTLTEETGEVADNSDEVDDLKCRMS